MTSNTRFLMVAIAFALAACATAEEKPAPAPPPPPPPPPEVSAHALCETLLRVEDAVARGKRADIARHFQSAALQDPKDAAARFGVAMSMEKENDRWQALKGDGELNPDSAVFPLGECFVYAWWKMPDQQVAPCDTAAARVKDLALVDVARGELLLRQGDTGAALTRFDAALGTDPKCVPALTAKARALVAKGDVPAARAVYEGALAIAPDCFSCATQLAAAVEQKDGPAASRSLWANALALAPDHAPTVQRYAATQVGTDDKAALAAYEKAIGLGVADKDTLVAAAQLADRVGNLERAIAHARKATAARKDDVATWRLLATLSAKKGDEAGALEANTKLLDLVPDDAAAHLALARSANKGGRFIDALTHYEAATRALADAGSGNKDGAASSVAANTEYGELLRGLKIPDKGAAGTATRVVATVQARVRPLYEAARKKSRKLKGTVVLTVVTRDDGSVKKVEIAKDGLKDARVAAALVGNLQRASIVGGAKRYSFELDFN